MSMKYRLLRIVENSLQGNNNLLVIFIWACVPANGSWTQSLTRSLPLSVRSINKAGERELWDLATSSVGESQNDALWVDSVGDTFISRGFDTPCGQTVLGSSRIAAEANMYPRFTSIFTALSIIPGH
jgi:hypothetical protein